MNTNKNRTLATRIARSPRFRWSKAQTEAYRTWAASVAATPQNQWSPWIQPPNMFGVCGGVGGLSDDEKVKATFGVVNCLGHLGYAVRSVRYTRPIQGDPEQCPNPAYVDTLIRVFGDDATEPTPNVTDADIIDSLTDTEQDADSFLPEPSPYRIPINPFDPNNNRISTRFGEAESVRFLFGLFGAANESLTERLDPDSGEWREVFGNRIVGGVLVAVRSVLRRSQTRHEYVWSDPLSDDVFAVCAGAVHAVWDSFGKPTPDSAVWDVFMGSDWLREGMRAAWRLIYRTGAERRIKPNLFRVVEVTRTNAKGVTQTYTQLRRAGGYYAPLTASHSYTVQKSNGFTLDEKVAIRMAFGAIAGGDRLRIQTWLKSGKIPRNHAKQFRSSLLRLENKYRTLAGVERV